MTVSTRSTSGSASPHRRSSLVVLAVGGLAFVLGAAFLVPWHPVPWALGPPMSPTAVFSPEQIARAEAFSNSARLLSLSSLAVSLLVASVLGFSAVGRRLMARIRGPWWVAVPVGCAMLLALGRIVTLPFALLLRDRVHAYGLSHQSLAAWSVDQAATVGVGAVFSSIVLLVLIGSARRWPRAWPAVAGAALGGLVLLGSFVYPVVVEPLFNHFTSLPDGPLRTSILQLADREGVPVDDVLVADASRRTTTLNAYVSGFGDTRRVVLYDNLVNDEPPAEILSVVAHELGHARHDDVLVGSMLGACGVLASVGLLGLLVGARRRLDAPAVVPLLLAMTAWGSVLGAPIENAISRQIETRADVDALVATRDPASFLAVQKELAVRGLSDPTPPALLQWWFGTHPTPQFRMRMASGLNTRPGPGQ